MNLFNLNYKVLKKNELGFSGVNYIIYLRPFTLT